MNYTISDKITPLWKRIGEPLEIKIGCYRGNPGQQRHSGSSNDLFWLTKTVRRLRHWKFPFAFILAGITVLCDLSYVTMNEKFLW